MDSRKISLSLFLFAMPWTVIDSGHGFFADSDDWQGYDVAFVWPFFFAFVLRASWDFIPIGFATAYILAGMWLTNAPKFIHVIGAGACCMVAMLVPLGFLRELRSPFVFLEAAWISAIVAAHSAAHRKPVNPPAPPATRPTDSN